MMDAMAEADARGAGTDEKEPETGRREFTRSPSFPPSGRGRRTRHDRGRASLAGGRMIVRALCGDGESQSRQSERDGPRQPMGSAVTCARGRTPGRCACCADGWHWQWHGPYPVRSRAGAAGQESWLGGRTRLAG